MLQITISMEKLIGSKQALLKIILLSMTSTYLNWMFRYAKHIITN